MKKEGALYARWGRFPRRLSIAILSGEKFPSKRRGGASFLTKKKSRSVKDSKVSILGEGGDPGDSKNYTLLYGEI